MATTETVEAIVQRQEGYGPAVVMGLGAALNHDPRIAVGDALWVLYDTLDGISDPVVGKALLRRVIDAIRMDVGLRPVQWDALMHGGR
jgi:hypothetical protein